MIVHAVALASSSASLGIAVSADFINTLDNSIREELQRTSHTFFLWVLISAFVVAAGVALEGPELLHEMWPRLFAPFTKGSVTRIRKFKRFIKKIGFGGWLLVVVGIVGEGIFEALQNRAEGQLQTFNDILLADAQRQSSVANERANGAYERAAETEREASQENERAAGTEKQASEENARAAEALKAAEVARKTAEGFALQIAQANKEAKDADARAAEANETAERERLARLQLEARLADRVITPDQQRRITEAFAPMRGQTVDIVILGDSREINTVVDAILGSIQKAGVLRNFSHPFSGGGAEGVVVGIRADAPDEDKRAGVQLITILRETLDGGVGQADFDKMVTGGAGTFGSDTGAAPAGKAAIRLQIAPK